MIEDEPDVIPRKPIASETPVTYGSKIIIGPLPCQELKEFYRGPKNFTNVVGKQMSHEFCVINRLNDFICI